MVVFSWLFVLYLDGSILFCHQHCKDILGLYTCAYRTIPCTGLCHTEGRNSPFLLLELWLLRTIYLQHSFKYGHDTAVTNANVVLVKLICDSSSPSYITLCLILL